MKKMKKKFIISLLIIIFLFTYMPIDVLKQQLESYAVTTTWQYNYSASTITWEVPYNGYYQIYCYGAQGNRGGKGSEVVGTIELAKGDILYITVGGQNGYNGGGSGTSWSGTLSTSYVSGSYSLTSYNGGGATDVRKGGTELSNRIIVAAGGRWRMF